jgi:hypothetical protein
MALASLPGQPDGVLAGTMGHRILRQDSAHRPWQASGSGLPAGSHGTVLLAGSEVPRLIWTGTMGQGVYVSRDGGHTWAPYGPPLSANAGIVLGLAEVGHRLLAGTAMGIYQLQ